MWKERVPYVGETPRVVCCSVIPHPWDSIMLDDQINDRKKRNRERFPSRFDASEFECDAAILETAQLRGCFRRRRFVCPRANRRYRADGTS